MHVVVVGDTLVPDTPDSISPNNWISFHENGTVALYPMFAENRRLERREDILDKLEGEGFVIENVIDYTEAENEEIFLEGTGSLLLDRMHRKAYCACRRGQMKSCSSSFARISSILLLFFTPGKQFREKGNSSTIPM